jgi:poly(hydroxyalkanoate) granule-associated protein
MAKAKQSKQAKQTVKDVQEDIRESAHKIWLAGLGALSAAEEEGSKLFKGLVERGKEFESRGRDEVKSTVKDVKSGVKSGVDKATRKVEGVWSDLGEGLDERITAILHRLGVPSRDEIQTLTRRIEELNQKVDGLGPKKAAATTKKSATTKKNAPAEKPAASKTSPAKAS